MEETRVDTVFVGAVEYSEYALKKLIDCGIIPKLVVTLPLRLSYRHSDFADLRHVAHQFNIPVLEVDNINDHTEEIAKYEPDYILVWGWSQLIKKELLNAPKFGCLGMHPSLLPKGRGRAVIPWTILTNTMQTGLSIFYLEEDVDSGPIVAQEIILCSAYDSARSLYDKTIIVMEDLIKQIVPKMQQGRLNGEIQDHFAATYFAKRIPADGIIDWSLSAYDIDRLIRATTAPYPGAFTFYKGQKVIIWKSEVIPNFNYTGIPGQILIMDGMNAAIQCGKKHLLITNMEVDGKPSIPSDVFKLHARFG